MTKQFHLPNGHIFLITFSTEGVTYDLVDAGFELVEELGFNLYEDLNLELINQPELP